MAIQQHEREADSEDHLPHLPCDFPSSPCSSRHDFPFNTTSTGVGPAESRPNTCLGLSPACTSFFCLFAFTGTLQGSLSPLSLPSFREIVLSHGRSVCPVTPLQAQRQPSQRRPSPREQDASLWTKREVELSSCRWQFQTLSGKRKPCCRQLLSCGKAILSQREAGPSHLDSLRLLKTCACFWKQIDHS